jgi:large subunit ribosomal protein L29
MAKKENLSALSADELNGRLNEEKARLEKIRFSHAVTPLTNPMEIRDARRMVARLNTELRKKLATA